MWLYSLVGGCRLPSHIEDAHGWELSEKRVEKMLGGDGGGHAASAPPQEGSNQGRAATLPDAQRWGRQ
jgi:hypothetical protein